MTTTTISCLNCSENFSVRAADANRGAKFCSRSCSAKFNTRKRYAESNKPNVKCAYCKEMFYKSEKRIERVKSGLHFCSRTHKDLAQRLDGLPALHLPHYGNGMHNYRDIAFRDVDSPECARCGFKDTPEVLQVHHKDCNRANNDISNLEIVCPTCHEVEHFKSGTGRWRPPS